MRYTYGIVVVLIGILIGVAACKKTKETQNILEPIVFNFDDSNKDLWHKLDSLENIQMYRSAREVAKEIIAKATRDNHIPDLINATQKDIYFLSYLEEESDEKTIAILDQLIENNSFPTKQLAYSLKAEFIISYANRFHWEIQERTPMMGVEKPSLEFMTEDQLDAEILNHLFLSLTEKEKLQEVDIREFKSLIDFGEDGLERRPTLYDLLAFDAIDYLKNSSNNTKSKKSEFQWENPKIIGTTSEFLSLDLANVSDADNQVKALQLIQSLTRFHQERKHIVASGTLDLYRMKMAKNEGHHSDEYVIFDKAYEMLSKHYEGSIFQAEVVYDWMSYLMENEDPNSAEYNPNLLNEIILACESMIEKYGTSLGGKNCLSLVQRLKSKNITFSLDEVVLPELENPIRIVTKNVNRLYYRIVKLESDFYTDHKNYTGRNFAEEVLKREAFKTWSKDLNLVDDKRGHSFMEILPELPVGTYMLFVSDKETMSLTSGKVCYQDIQCSNLSIGKITGDEYNHLVRNRTTGLPISGALVEVFYGNRWGDASQKGKVLYTKKTNSDGKVNIPYNEERNNVLLKTSYSEDVVYDHTYTYSYEGTNSVRETHRFFTDRAIYRPGQTVYFKGIIYEGKSNDYKVLKNKKIKVWFNNPNWEKVEEIELRTNDYGSISGSFVIPQNGLNGSYSLGSDFQRQSIQVEEYKRPKFEVTTDPIEGSYALKEEVKITGKAMSYAGAVIDGAEVNYRVQRTARFPWWCWYRYGFNPSSPSVEITHGTALTDEKGAFELTFEAIPDLDIDPKLSPIFNYEITVDVTDVNGETRSTSTRVSVAYQSLYLDVDLAGAIDKSSMPILKITSKNLNGKDIEANGTVEIIRLVEPKRLTRLNHFGNCKDTIYSEEEYMSSLPLDDRLEKPTITSLKEGASILNTSFDSEAKDSLVLNDLKSWDVGRYKLILLAKDANGKEVKEEKFFTVYDSKGNKAPNNEMFWHKANKNVFEPGETFEFIYGTAAKNVHLRYTIFSGGEELEEKTVSLSDEQKTITFDVKEKHRGGVVLNIAFLKDNRWYSHTERITVPFTNKELDVSFETFRSKLLPGQKEEWKIKIKGINGDRVAAELMATMYDASLDAFASNNINFNLYNQNFESGSENPISINSVNGNYTGDRNDYYERARLTYPNFKWSRIGFDSYYRYDLESVNLRSPNVMYAMDEMAMDANNETYAFSISDPAKMAKGEFAEEDIEPDLEMKANGMGDIFGADAGGKSNQASQVKARTNFNETAFFFPDLKTDKDGNVILSFTMPESLTEWNFIGLSHTKDLSVGMLKETIITQKDLMVTTNVPRFLREGDKMTISAKINNLSEKDLSGEAQLFLVDTRTDLPVENVFSLTETTKSFTVKKDLSNSVSWTIDVPEGQEMLTWKVVAVADDFSDGEEAMLPILSNRMLVTESMPMSIRGKQEKTFNFEKLGQFESSSTLKNHNLTVEFTSNPAWYAVQSMPYLMEYPYECAEQMFSRFYSNSLAEHMMNSNPKIKQVFDTWKIQDAGALLSNLEKNQELKSILLQETPWVLDAKNEAEQKKKMALLFDMNHMSLMKSQTKKKIIELQNSDGSWSWFKGMAPSAHITRHIASGIGHLKQLGVTLQQDEARMADRAVSFLDEQLRRDFNKMKSRDENYLTNKHLGSSEIQYFYMRSFFADKELPESSKEAFDYYWDQMKEYWTDYSIYFQGMIALSLDRKEDKGLAQTIVKSLKERSIVSEEMGMYWKSNTSGYYWYQAPIETQAIVIEAFSEITKDKEAVEEMKIWLLKQKQTTNWETTKATTEAIYAILLQGTDLLADNTLTEIYLDNKKVNFESAEAGTGYVKKSWNPSEIKEEMSEVKMKKTSNGIGWGAMYWQYFEDLDKITSSETGLVLRKEIYVVKNTDEGEKLVPMEDGVKVGDKLRVRIELEADRDFEYVHLKDMRASGYEPTNVISRYKWQGGIGYYESTKDASTNFFIDYLQKGKYVFEYDLRVFQSGDFSNGIASIQCMYAPEFNSHSEGSRSVVE